MATDPTAPAGADDLRDRIEAEFPCRCDVGPDCPWHGYAVRFLAVRDEELERLRAGQANERCTCGETACESELCDCDAIPCPVNHRAEAAEAELKRLRAKLAETQVQRETSYSITKAAIRRAERAEAERDALKDAIQRVLTKTYTSTQAFVADLAAALATPDTAPETPEEN